MTILNENPIHIIADEGKLLTNNEIYAKEIYLGIHDSPSNWHEILENEVPEEQEQEEDYAAAARILLGMER